MTNFVNQIINDDCLNFLKKMEEKTIDCVITSPPYNIGIKYDKYKDNKLTEEQYLELMYEIFKELKRVLKDNGSIYLNVGYTNKFPLIDINFIHKIKDLFVVQNRIVWVKSISIKKESYGNFKPINSKRYIAPTNESLFHLTKKGNVPINKLNIGVPYKYKCNLNERKKKKNKTNKPKRDCRDKGNSWFIPYKTIKSKKDKFHHPAIFPDELVEHCLKLSDLPKESIILDPFLGTGTTCIVSKKMGYNYIGIELSEDFCNLARKRLEDINMDEIKEIIEEI